MAEARNQEGRLSAKGLHSQPNVYSEVPDGALKTANNANIDREGVITPRRGFEALTGALGSGSDRAKAFTEYQDTVVAAFGTNGLAYYTGSAWTAYTGTFAPPTDERMRFVQANQNLYFTTSTGLKKLAAYTAAVGTVGVPKALHSTLVHAASGTSALTTGNIVAYRYVWGIRDANNNLIYSAPSQRVEISNTTGSTKDITHTVYIPADIGPSHFLQIYRSKAVASTTTPSDELYLAHEAIPTGAEITAKTMTATDSTPEALLGALLYTNPSQEGVLQANDQPPLATDADVYKDYVFLANTQTKHRFYLTLIGTGTPNGVQNDDTLVIAGVTYTAKASETVGSGFFKAFTGGSAASDIADTAKSLVNVINRYASNTLVYAYYVSGADDLPGKILIEERGIGGSSFNTQVSRESAFSPEGLTTAQASSNDNWANGLFYSKRQQPESFPLLSYLRVGSANDPIVRIKALRDSLFIFKRTEGIYRLTGETPGSFTVTLFDSSVRLLGKETLAVLNNQIYGLFDQGVATVSETGVNIVSRPIEKTLLELQGAALAGVKTYGWACAYESDRKYLLHLPTNPSDTATNQTFVYNYTTDAWTRWGLSRSAGFVRPSDDFLYVGDATSTTVSKERKTYTYRDHVDEALTRSITAVNGLVLTLDDVSGVAAGDVIYQTSSIFSIISEVDTFANTATVLYSPGFTVASCSVLKAFETEVEWHPFTAGNPTALKRWRECHLIFEKEPRNATIAFSTDFVRAQEELTLTSVSAGLWGTFGWGSTSWGGSVGEKSFRTYVTRDHQRANVLRVKWVHSVGFTNWALNGVAVDFTPISQRNTR